MKVNTYITDIVGAYEIVSLTTGKDGCIYGGFTGTKGHLLFRYRPEQRSMEDLGEKIKSGTQLFNRKEKIGQKIHHALDTAPDGKIVGGTGQNIAIVLPYYRTEDDEGGHLFVFDPVMDQSRDLGIPVAHEWIINTTLSPSGDIIYGMTYPLNHVFRCNIESGEMKVLGQVRGFTLGDSGVSHECICDAEGDLYGSCSAGYLFKYDCRKDKLIETDIKLPGDDIRIDSLLRVDNVIYGGTWENGYLFSFDPHGGTIETLGKPNDNGPRLPALVLRDGRIYGAAGGGSQYNTRSAFLFEYDPHNGKLTEIGDVFDSENNIRAQRIHAMAVGQDGCIYAGETGAENIEAGETGLMAYFFICKLD